MHLTAGCCNSALWCRLTGACTRCRFAFSPEGSFFRQFLMDELVKSVDALSREQLAALVARLGLEGVRLPVLLPGGQGQGPGTGGRPHCVDTAMALAWHPCCPTCSLGPSEQRGTICCACCPTP